MSSHTKEQILKLVKDIYDIEFLQELQRIIKDQMHSSIKEIEKIKAFKVNPYTFEINEVTINKIAPKNGKIRYEQGINVFYDSPFGEYANLFENKIDAEKHMKVLLEKRLKEIKEYKSYKDEEESILKSKLENLK